MLKILGAIFIITSCGGFGFALAGNYRKQEFTLCQMIRMLEIMESELQYKLTPLPALCRNTAKQLHGILRKTMVSFSEELDRRSAPDASSCMRSILQNYSFPSKKITLLLIELGDSLGHYDMAGQLRGIKHIQSTCVYQLELLHKDQQERIRCYQTLGLCAGAALVILFV